MNWGWFKGTGAKNFAETPVAIESVNRAALLGPEHYEADPALVDAVNTALLLDQPLLLTGEPGTGKTQLAERLALELGLKLFDFETKSTSVAQDLFYTFDHVARFQAAQVWRLAQPEAGAATALAAPALPDLHPLRFVEYQALGRAILQSLEPTVAQQWFAGGDLPLWYRGPQRAVVLIDEIDKAPTDFPNDVLSEIERHYFRLREWESRKVHADAKRRPIVVITSNSEKQLPDAFLRRCLFHHLRPLTKQQLESIATKRLAARKVRQGALLDSALQLYLDLRDEGTGRFDLRKKPSTAEFLAFLTALSRDDAFDPDRPLTNPQARRVRTTLLKAQEDEPAAARHPLLAPPR